ncbi:MAG: CAP domain-containing protein [Catenulispora sp.]
MDIRTWQDADRPDVPESGFEDFSDGQETLDFGYSYPASPGSRPGTAFTATDVISLGPADRSGEPGGRAAYSARHRSHRSPFSPLRPAPIAIGSLSTAAIAAFAFVGPGILHGGMGASPTPMLDGLPNRIAPLAPATSSVAATIPAPAAASTDSPAEPGAPAGGGPTSSPTSVPNVLTSTHAPSGPGAPSSPGRTSPPATQPPPSSPGRPLNPPILPPSQPPAAPPTSAPLPPATPPSAPPSTPPTSPVPPVTPPTSPKAPTFNSAAAVSSALTEISTVRSWQGAAPLSVDSTLVQVASKHTSDMVRTRKFSHNGSDGSSPDSRAQSMGCWALTKELIARGKPGDDIVRALMQDPDARQALLGFWNHKIGISAQQDPETGDVYWTIELAWT